MPSLQKLPIPLLTGYGLLALVLLFNLGFGVLQPPNLGFYTTDEQFIADSGVFMLYGATPRCLDWPAVPMLLVFQGLILGQWVLTLAQNLSAIHSLADVFAVGDQLAYNYLTNRTPLIIAGRLIQILLSVALLIPAVQIVSRSGRIPDGVRLPVIMLITINPDTLTGFGVLRPEAIAYSLAVWLTIHLLFTNSQRSDFVTIALVLAGMLFAQRLIYVFLLPFIVGALYLRDAENRPDSRRFDSRRFMALTGWMVVATLWWLPFFWTNLLVVAKAFAGGVAMKMTHEGSTGPFNIGFIGQTLTDPAGLVAVVLTGIGAGLFLRQYPARWVAWLFVATGSLYLLNVLRSPLIYPTHTLPVRTAGIVLLGYGIGGFGRLKTLITNWLPTVIAGVLACWFGWNGYLFQRNAHLSTNLADVLTWYNALPADTPVAMEPEFSSWVNRSTAALDFELQATNDTLLTRQKLRRLAGAVGGSVTTTAQPVLMTTSLLEDERLFTVQNQILRQYTPARTHPTPQFFSLTTGFVNYFITVQQATEGVKNGQFRYLVMAQQQPGLTPVKTYADKAGLPYFVYAATTTSSGGKQELSATTTQRSN